MLTAASGPWMPVSFGATRVLVADVELQQHRGERLDRRWRCDSSPASSGRQPGSCATISLTSLDGVRVVASRSARRVSIGWSRSPSSLAGRWWNAATTRQPGTAACTCAATEPRGGTSGWNSWPTRTSALAIRSRPCRRSCVVRAPARSSPRSPTAWRSRRGRLGGAVVVAGVDGELAVRPLARRARREPPSPGTSTASRSRTS